MHGLTSADRFRRTVLAGLLGLSLAGVAHAQQSTQGQADQSLKPEQSIGAALELVDPQTLRVCADPHNLPFSNEAGEGFENKIADLLGRKLGKPVAYTFFPQVIGFYRTTLNAYRCDVVVGVAKGEDAVQTTSAYYHTTYALLFKSGSGLDEVRSLADPRLRDKRIGVIARTPPSTVMARNGLMDHAKPYPLTVDTRVESPALTMVQDLAADRIDAGVLWGPIAGYYARQYAKDGVAVLSTAPLLQETDEHMDFRIAMGVRHSDEAWKLTLNRLLHENRAEIRGILESYGVPLLDEQGKPLTP